VGVAAGLWASNDLRGAGDDALGCVWFDAHDDYNVPDTVVSGYFDSQGIAMMAGECWKALLNTVPGFRPMQLRKVIHCGMRDVNDLERSRVEASDMGVVWGDATKKVDFERGLRKEL
jgi:arginase